jgi:ankyrin repeat protein
LPLLVLVFLCAVPSLSIRADGGYFGRSESVTSSADQRAILLKTDNTVSMTLSTAYTGEGEEFAWIIPTPVPPNIDDVFEPGADATEAFTLLDGISAPIVTTSGGGCFPAGTLVSTPGGAAPIETIEPGALVDGFDAALRKWVVAQAGARNEHSYSGEIVTIRTEGGAVKVTANHPFLVIQGEALSRRPPARDVPPAQRQVGSTGRWVEAGDLEEGDALLARGGKSVPILSLSRETDRIQVYNLLVDDCHTYAVGPAALIVHNKGGAEGESVQPVTVYGTKRLAHYEASVVGGSSSQAILDWLREKGYEVDPRAESILADYVSRGWVFVAVRLAPGERRHYENEFLEPLTVRYQADALVFPLLISSVSTDRESHLSIFVLAGSTVRAANFVTLPLSYEQTVSAPIDPYLYIRDRLRRTVAAEGSPPVILMWRGRVDGELRGHNAIATLAGRPLRRRDRLWLTRLELVLQGSAMTRDLELLLDRKPKDFTVRIVASEGYYSALVRAAGDGDLELVRELLDARVSLESTNEYGDTPLQKAAEKGQLAVVDTLLKAGARLHVGSSTALYPAVKGGNLEIVKRLIDAGADVKEETAYTLLWAAGSGDEQMVEALLQAGADVNAEVSPGYSISAQGGRRNLVLTALSAAVRTRSPRVLQVLIDSGIDVNRRQSFPPHQTRWNAADSTALIEAARMGETEMVRSLLEAGADIEARDQDGESALDVAISGGNNDAIELLRAVRARESHP